MLLANATITQKVRYHKVKSRHNDIPSYCFVVIAKIMRRQNVTPCLHFLTYQIIFIFKTLFSRLLIWDITGIWYRIRNYLIMRNGYLYLLNFEIIEIKSFFFSGTIHPVILFCKPISSLLNII